MMASVSEPADTSARPIRLAIITNIPAPYRVPVYNLLARLPGIKLKAIYAAPIEPDRHWDLPAFEHEHQFLKTRFFELAGRFIHYNPDVWAALREFAPDVVLITGFNPTHLIAFLYALLHRRRHVVMTDGTDRSERRLSLMHRCVRRVVFAASQAFVVASQGGWRLLRGYGVAEARIHFSPLCANTEVSWAATGDGLRDIDLIFSGRLVEIKNADFALEVALGVAARLGRRVTLALLGSGAQEGELRTRAAQIASEVEVLFAGHVTQAQVPQWFLRARVFLFPTRWDPWGVVANEACLAGLPVLISPYAGAAGELVRDGFNGRILPLQVLDWVEAAADLLADADLWERMSAQAREAVAPYTFENAAFGIADAVRQAVAKPFPARP